MLPFSFAKRKIQNNRYTHWITLPPEWLSNMGIGKGDELSVEMTDEGLLIKPVRIAPTLNANSESGQASRQKEASK